MKRLIIGLLLGFLMSCLLACQSEDPISFSDNHLEDAIRTEIEKPNDDIYKKDVADIVKLDLSGLEIEKLDGIEAIESTETLSLEDNNISDFSPLNDLEQLEKITVIGNPFLAKPDQVTLLEELEDQGVTVKTSMGDPDGPGGFLWKVKNGDTTVYLQGTIHIGKKELFPMNEAIENAYTEADIVVPEVDLNNVSIQDTQAITNDIGMYHDGTDIQDHISDSLYKQLENKMNELGLPIQTVKDFKPWLLANTIEQFMVQKIGFTTGVDEYFLHRAEKDKKEVIGLETVEDQLSIFADTSPEMQEQMLDDALVDINTYEDQMDQLLSLYMDGDHDELLDYLRMEDDLEPADSEEASDEDIAFMEALNDERNKEMADEIGGFLEEDTDVTYFVIIGTLHLTMEPHVRSILEKKGYEIEEIL